MGPDWFHGERKHLLPGWIRGSFQHPGKDIRCARRVLEACAAPADSTMAVSQSRDSAIVTVWLLDNVQPYGCMLVG